ncbi:MAG: hypothetical protein WKF43_03920 [Acidimicrobiales bacterium]
MPPVRNAQVWADPAETADQVVAVPTCCGNVPFAPAVWPNRPKPQHHSVPSARVAHVWFPPSNPKPSNGTPSPPAVTVAQSVADPTRVGAALSVVVPSPSAPSSF